MAGYFDTHVHFDGICSDVDAAEEIVSAAALGGVTGIMAVGGSSRGNHMALDVAEQCPHNVIAAVGCDRDCAGQPGITEETTRLAREAAVRGIGEIGLDYYYHPETRQAQLALFEEMLALARELKLPVIVHSRNADDDTLAVLKGHAELFSGTPDKIGVLHCFTRDMKFANQLLDLGFYISFSGIISFKNAAVLREVARFIPADRILIETDSPYLAPEPYRGKQNRPLFVKEVAGALAAARGENVETVAEAGFKNACRLFSISCPPFSRCPNS